MGLVGLHGRVFGSLLMTRSVSLAFGGIDQRDASISIDSCYGSRSPEDHYRLARTRRIHALVEGNEF